MASGVFPLLPFVGCGSCDSVCLLSTLGDESLQVALLPGLHTPRTSRVLSHELSGLGDRREPSVPSSWGGTIWGTGVNPDWPSRCWVSRCCSFVVLFLGLLRAPKDHRSALNKLLGPKALGDCWSLTGASPRQRCVFPACVGQGATPCLTRSVVV